MSHFSGSGPSDINTARLYLQIPVRARPRLSYFFDSEYYLVTNPDVGAAGVDPFIHFVQYGCAESRPPHPLIDFSYMRSLDEHLFSSSPSVTQLHEALSLNLVDPSPYFSLDYYKGQAWGSDESDRGLLGHFLSEGLLAGLRPNPFLDPLWYYRQLDEPHDLLSGPRHFVLEGDRQGMAPSAELVKFYYLRA